jgi:pantoate--beta-alanine ligase
MGALHQGHMRLVEASKRECDVTVASIFVNPTQFAPTDDLAQYPRPIEDDIALLRSHAVDALFLPSVDEMHGSSSSKEETNAPLKTRVLMDGAESFPGEGSVRPGHFEGVATVVSKLFNVCSGLTHAFFGQKDGLQLIVIRKLVADLDFNVRVRMVATERERDGLAMSSRNVYLNAEQRAAAPALYAALCAGRDVITSAVAASAAATDEKQQQEQLLTAARVVHAVRESLRAEPLFTPEYVTLLDAHSGREFADGSALDAATTRSSDIMITIAAKIGAYRLLDNIIVDAAAAAAAKKQ